MCYTNCGCSCGCSATCGCYESICPSCHSCSTTTTTTTTTINPDCEPCDTFYDCECIVYSGPNVQCYGLQTGDNLCEILDVILSHLPQCSTTTTAPPLNCTFTAIASLTVPTTTSTTSTTSTSTTSTSTTSTSTSSTTSTSTSSTSTTSTTTTTTCACHTITNTTGSSAIITVTYCGQSNPTEITISGTAPSNVIVACLSSYVAEDGIVFANCGTSCTTAITCTFCTTSTTTTSTTSTTTTTTTSFCIANGFPEPAYAALFWSQGELDTSATITCDSNPVLEPSQSKSVWIAFFSDAALTIPLATTLNNYLITVGGSPYSIGSGTTEYAYFVDYFPYSSNPIDPLTCTPGETIFETLPVLASNACFTVVTETGIADGDMIIERGAGDPTTNDYSADLANCLYSPGTGTPIEVVINSGEAGPITQSNIAGYCNVTIRELVLSQGYTITIVGTANDGSSGETISVPFAVSTSVNSIKNYFLDSNHSITVTVDEIP